MESIILWASKNRLLAMLIAAAIVAFGLFSALNLPIDAVPDVTNTQVQVVTRAPALSAPEVETQVTQPVEREMAGLPGLVNTRSTTKLGISIVTLIFDDATDVYFARAQVNERLGTLRQKIPERVGTPELGPISTALGEIYMFELAAENPARSPEDLRTMLEWQLGPRLRQVPGVIEVVGFGGGVKQYRVTLDPARLAAHQVSVQEVHLALERDNRVEGGGYLEHEGEQIVLRGDARFFAVEDVRAVVVKSDARGVPVRVGQLGAVDTASAPRQGAMTRDGRGEIVGASILMLKGKNSRQVVADVKLAIADIEKTLPQGVTIKPYYDRADFIDRVLGTVAKNLVEGALITVVCLLLTLGSLRAGFLVAGAIPFSLLVGFIGLRALGYSGNVMSLGAVDFGIIVEGAVVSVEHALAHGAHAVGRRDRLRAIVRSMQEVAKPALFVVVITLLVFLPLATLEDVEGKMFRPVVFSLCFMLLGAIVYAFVVIPAIGPAMLLPALTERDPWLIRQLRRFYVPSLDFALRRPVLTIAVSFALTAGAAGVASRIGADFLPRIFEGSFAVDTLRPPSTSLTQAIALGKETELALRESPEVETVVNRIGRPEGAVDPAGPESSDVFVILKPRSQWRPGLTPEALANELSKRVAERVPATISAFSQPIEMRVNDLVAGVKSDVAIKIYSEDLGAASEYGERLRRAIARVPGASDFKVETPFGLPSIRVVVNRERAGRLGVRPGDALDVLAMSRAGMHAGQVREGERVFDMVLRLGGDSVDSAHALSRLPVATNEGKLVPMAMVADVTEERTVVQVSREQMKRRLLVQGNVRGRDVVGFVKEAQAEAAKVEQPRGVQVEWGGQFQNFNRAKARLGMLVPVAVGVIALLLTIMFKRARLVVLTLLNLPFAIAGGAAALVVRGLPFSIPAGVGLIALAGVAVCTGIVMTNAYDKAPRDLPPLERVRRAALAALRARISTALIASIGFIPAAIATGTGSEVQRPLATVVIGGLLFSTAISLLAFPAMLLVGAGHRTARDDDDEDDERLAEGDAAPAPAAH